MHRRIATLIVVALVSLSVQKPELANAGRNALPANLFSRVYGASGDDDRALNVAITAESVYLVGLTNGLDFPITAGAFDRRHNGDYDGFVMCTDRRGQLRWATYLGSPGSDTATGVDVDADGNVYVSGSTTDAAFPTTPGAMRTTFAGSSEGFVAKLSPDGKELLYSTFVGGTLGDNATRVKCGPEGTVTVAGATGSPEFPRIGAAQPAFGGQTDAFVLQLDASGSTALRSTTYGGAGGETVEGMDMAVDGTVWITGLTTSTNYPTVLPTQPTYGGGFTDGHVARFSPAGVCEFATYLGGAGLDIGIGVAIDPFGRGHAVGTTDAMSFPTTPDAAQSTGAGNFDGFLATFDGVSMTYATLIGGPGSDAVGSVDATADVIAATGSCGPGFVATDAPAVKGTSDAFVAYYDPELDRFETRIFGGSGDEAGRAIALDEGSVGAIAAGSTSTDLATPSIIGPREQVFLMFAGPVVDLPPTEASDLSIDVTSVPLETSSRNGGSFFIEIRNQGPRDYVARGDERVRVAVKIEADALCGVQALPVRISREPAGSDLSVFQLTEELEVSFRRLKVGESIRVEFGYTYAEGCQPGSRVVCGARFNYLRDNRLENNYDTDELRVPEKTGKKLLSWNFTENLVRVAYVSSFDAPPTSPPGRMDDYIPAGLRGFRIYASATPNVTASPENLVMEVLNPDLRWIAPNELRDDYYRVAPLWCDDVEGPLSNEVGGPLPTISSIIKQRQKLIVNGSGFHSSPAFYLGGIPLIPPPKIRNEGTKVIQKLKFSMAGLTVGELVDAGESSVVFGDVGNDNFLMLRF